MATRPVFAPQHIPRPDVKEHAISFAWAPGFALSQRRKSVQSLHDATQAALGMSRILEVSSRSEQLVGQRCSAFNLTVDLADGRRTTVESAFQGSKVFRDAGPFHDLYDAQPAEARRETRARTTSDLIGFNLLGSDWPISPTFAFYDHLIFRAILAVAGLLAELATYEAFTDIEFNPSRSMNCQARSIARLVALTAAGVDPTSLSQAQFLGLYDSVQSTPEARQAELF